MLAKRGNAIFLRAVFVVEEVENINACVNMVLQEAMGSKR
jgi:hypothetical protein